MPYPFTLGEHKLNIPMGFHELTLKQLIDIETMPDRGDIPALMAILTGVKRKVFFDAVMDTATEEQLLFSINWLIKFSRGKLKIDFSVPYSIKVGEKELVIPTDLGQMSFGQKMNCQQVFLAADETGNLKYVYAQEGNIVGLNEKAIEIYPEALAIYLQTLYTEKPFEDGKVLRDMIKLCEKIPVSDGAPVANFFLRKYLGLETLKVKSFGRKTASSRRQRTPLEASPTSGT